MIFLVKNSIKFVIKFVAIKLKDSDLFIIPDNHDNRHAKRTN